VSPSRRRNCKRPAEPDDQVCFALEFGTGEGEGGPFALYMTLFPKRDPTDEQRSLTTYTTMDSKAPREKGRLGKLANLRWPLLVWAIFGTALTLSDGILTWVRAFCLALFALELARNIPDAAR
jgi:KUP system potassium uptake protein